MRTLLIALAILVAVPALAANVWSERNCTATNWCAGTLDTVGMTDRVRTRCESGTSMDLQGNATLVVDVYSCATETLADCTRSRAVNEAGATVDVTLDSTTRRAKGLIGHWFTLDVQSGSGVVLVGCGG